MAASPRAECQNSQQAFTVKAQSANVRTAAKTGRASPQFNNGPVQDAHSQLV